MHSINVAPQSNRFIDTFFANYFHKVYIYNDLEIREK